MKKLILSAVVLACLTVSAGTNDITISITLSDVQAEQLKFLKRYFGAVDLTLKQFATNVVVQEIKWSPKAEEALSQRRQRIEEAVASVDDTLFKSLENVLNLPDLTNSVPFMNP